MPSYPDETELHRTAKLFMDSGRAPTYEAALALLREFGLNVVVGSDVACSPCHQSALLSLVNTARRTLLGGVVVTGLPDVTCNSPLASHQSLRAAVEQLGGTCVAALVPQWPTVVIGTADINVDDTMAWRLTWEGWRGGAMPLRYARRMNEDDINPLAPILAAAVGAAEVFSYLTQDNSSVGKRMAGLSLWNPDQDWTAPDAVEPAISYLPQALWFLGLGNLGQAFAWCLAALPYRETSKVDVILQDHDRIAKSNESTSMLSSAGDVGERKTRVVAAWLKARGFESTIEERRFGPMTKRTDVEPGLLLCGVDNARTRTEMGDAGFDLIVEAGLGAGPQAFRSIAVHTFPASRTPAEVWARHVGQDATNYENQPAYRKLKTEGMDACGLARLASRTVGVPFVGLIAACLVYSEILRRLNGGAAAEIIATSAAALSAIEIVYSAAGVYSAAAQSTAA